MVHSGIFCLYIIRYPLICKFCSTPLTCLLFSKSLMSGSVTTWFRASFRYFLLRFSYLSGVPFPQCDTPLVIHPSRVTGYCLLKFHPTSLEFSVSCLVLPSNCLGRSPVSPSNPLCFPPLDCKPFEGIGQKGHRHGIRNISLTTEFPESWASGIILIQNHIIT